MQVKYLSGLALDLYVAKAAKIDVEIREGVAVILGEHGQSEIWSPSTNWQQAGRIIEREWLSLTWSGDNHASGEGPHCSIKRGGQSFQHGRTRLEAMMRAFVANTIGEEVPDLAIKEHSAVS